MNTATPSAPLTPEWLSYDWATDVLTIHGKRYSGLMFGEGGFLSSAGTVLRIEHGPSDCVTVTTVHMANEIAELRNKLALVELAINSYHADLSARKHGGVAQNTAIGRIEDALALHWRQGVQTVAQPGGITPAKLVHQTAKQLLDVADQTGNVVTIERKPLQPLAMGNACYQVDVRPARSQA